ncbi:MAG: RNA methyltransferase [Ignavibacteriae bacterium]|nr:RNA methyltransferase [Ignavibacteriota bacterium]
MLKIQNIHSLDAQGLELYRTLRMPLEHQRQGMFVAEGEKVVRRLVESDLPVVSMLLTPEWLSILQSLLESRQQSIDVFVAKKELVEGIVGFNLHQGIMAVGKIPEPARLNDMLQRSAQPYFFVAIDGLTNSENLGVLVRNCVGFGVQALLVGETSSSPYLRRAVRNSMGTVFKLPVVHVGHLVETLKELRTAHGIRCIAAHPHGTGETLHQTDFRKDCCVVFGSEGEGISVEVLAACDAHAAIPMHNGVDSLNVASASAAFLYEVVRQRMKQ